MTLNDILVAALAQLDRGHDAQTLDMWRDKLTRFANDAMFDLANFIKPCAKENVRLDGDKLDTAKLTKPCVKIIKIEERGNKLSFYDENLLDSVGVRGQSAKDAFVTVTYRCMPGIIVSPTDEPALPRSCHSLIVTYVVGRERASNDVSTQRGANVYFQMYEAGKQMLKNGLGSDDSYKIINRW